MRRPATIEGSDAGSSTSAIMRVPVAPSIAPASSRRASTKLGAAVGVDQAGRKGAREDDQHRAADAGAEPEGGERHPGDRRDEAQRLEERRDDVVEAAKPAHHQAERHADRGGEAEADQERPRLDARCCWSVSPTKGVWSAGAKRSTTAHGVGRKAWARRPRARGVPTGRRTRQSQRPTTR